MTYLLVLKPKLPDSQLGALLTSVHQLKDYQSYLFANVLENRYRVGDKNVVFIPNKT